MTRNFLRAFALVLASALILYAAWWMWHAGDEGWEQERRRLGDTDYATTEDTKR